MISRVRKLVKNYINSDKQYPTLIAVASGLYPLLYCYSRNFSLVNSFEHFLFFIVAFIVLPIGVFNAGYWIVKRTKLKRYGKNTLAFLNVFTFLYLIKSITFFGLHLKKTLLVIIVAILFGIFLKKHLKKLVLFQYLLSFVALLNLIPIIYTNLKISNEWQNQPDHIIDVEFKTKPNVYVIQPDGYVNFSEIDKGFYNFDNGNFKTFLKSEGFTLYPNFRSNYSTTLSSNSSAFMMKHHYYNNKVSSFEIYNGRDMIVSENPVLDIFKNNGYKTHFITETGYMLFNRPHMGFDYCNIDYADIPFVNPGITTSVDIKLSLKTAINNDSNSPKFFFLQILKPWHINSRKMKTSDKVIEKEKWIESLKEANVKLTEIIHLIKQQDSEALIVIMSDHGGYVGMNYTDESEEKSQDRDMIYSIFSSQLAIYWPQEIEPNFNVKFKSSVNTFRLLFSYLSKDETYLKHLQPDESYMVLKKGTTPGIYKYIDAKDEMSLEKYLEE
jgi:hypothetical protein